MHDSTVKSTLVAGFFHSSKFKGRVANPLDRVTLVSRVTWDRIDDSAIPTQSWPSHHITLGPVPFQVLLPWVQRNGDWSHVMASSAILRTEGSSTQSCHQDGKRTFYTLLFVKLTYQLNLIDDHFRDGHCWVPDICV